MQFNAAQQKKCFYSLYLGKIPIKPEIFNLTNEKRIIVSENLTQKNAAIFKLAQKAKFEKKIAQVHTDDGVIKVKLLKGPNQRRYTVRNTTDLEVLVEQQKNIAIDVNTNAQDTPQHTSTATVHTDTSKQPSQSIPNASDESSLMTNIKYQLRCYQRNNNKHTRKQLTQIEPHANEQL